MFGSGVGREDGMRWSRLENTMFGSGIGEGEDAMFGSVGGPGRADGVE